MSEFELWFPTEGSKYGDGVVLNKYGDRYSILAARESKEGGTIFKEWCFPQDKDKQPRGKSIPLGVRLGNHGQTVQTLKLMLAALEKPQAPSNTAASVAKTMGGKPADTDDIPF